MNTAVITTGGSPREPQKQFFVFVFVFILITLLIIGCKGSQQLAVTERVTHDTCYLSNIRYDSVYINCEHYQEYHLNPLNRSSAALNPDTVFIKDVCTEFRYKLLRDTIFKVQCDSIPYPVRVTETKTECYTPWYARTLAFIGFLFLIWFAFKVFLKIRFNCKITSI